MFGHVGAKSERIQNLSCDSTEKKRMFLSY